MLNILQSFTILSWELNNSSSFSTPILTWIYEIKTYKQIVLNPSSFTSQNVLFKS